MSSLFKQKKGFSLTEMLVVMAITLIMLGVTLASFPKLRNQIALSTALHGLQLNLRQAQAYAISVREFQKSFVAPICQTGVAPPARFPPYGISITKIDPADSRNASTYVLFADISCTVKTVTMPVYDAANYPLIGGFSKVITTTAMQGGVKVSSITGYTGAVSEALDIVDIVYQRPSPSITFIGRRVSGGVWVKTYTRIDITLSANDGSTKTISVRLSGQVSLQ